jgi:hypothetical protein
MHQTGISEDRAGQGVCKKIHQPDKQFAQQRTVNHLKRHYIVPVDDRRQQAVGLDGAIRKDGVNIKLISARTLNLPERLPKSYRTLTEKIRNAAMTTPGSKTVVTTYVPYSRTLSEIQKIYIPTDIPARTTVAGQAQPRRGLARRVASRSSEKCKCYPVARAVILSSAVPGRTDVF